MKKPVQLEFDFKPIDATFRATTEDLAREVEHLEYLLGLANDNLQRERRIAAKSHAVQAKLKAKFYQLKVKYLELKHGS